MALSGVEVHGQLHRQRLYDGFYRRESILFQIVATLATAMMRYENQDSVIKQVRRLGDLLYPEDPEKKLEREEELKDVLRREGTKSYKVMKINLGERRE